VWTEADAAAAEPGSYEKALKPDNIIYRPLLGPTRAQRRLEVLGERYRIVDPDQDPRRKPQRLRPHPGLHRGGLILSLRAARRPDRRLRADLRHEAGGTAALGEGGVGGAGAAGCVRTIAFAKAPR
jgi:hypothetical protein